MAVDQQQKSDAAPAIAFGPLLAAFTAAIFLSAALLFAVQPMFTKMVLPQLGGSAAVWSVAIVFFQAVLLAGYAYAHLITRYLPTRVTLFVHVAVMLVATLALPLAVAVSFGRPPTEGEALWLIGLFGVSIGLPFFALSATGPLLQAWFARSDHPRARVGRGVTMTGHGEAPSSRSVDRFGAVAGTERSRHKARCHAQRCDPHGYCTAHRS